MSCYESTPKIRKSITSPIRKSKSNYVEFHARSAFSFLEGSSMPEELIGASAAFNMPAMALLDRDGLYGAARFHLAAKKAGIKAHIGAEVTYRFVPQETQGCAETEALIIADRGKNQLSTIDNPFRDCSLPLIAINRTGYQNLCRLITRMKLRAKKEQDAVFEDELEEYANGLVCLTGGDNGPLASALARGGSAEGRRCLERLTYIFGHENVYVELQRHFHRDEEFRNRAALEVSRSLRLPL